MISVVIPTYNRAALLCRVLPTYLKSQIAGEIIIVDDAGSDDTAERIKSFQTDDPRVRYVRNEKNLGAPASRNRGASLAAGAWILQSEDDLELGEDFLETLLDHAQAGGADVIAGRRIWMRLGESREEALRRANAERRSKRPPFHEFWMDHNSQAITPADVECPIVDGTMLVRREVSHAVPYHAPFGGQSTWREESDVQLRAIELGYRVVFCPHAVCFHHSRSSQSYGPRRLRGSVAYAYRVFRNNLAFLKRHEALLRRDYSRALLLGSPFLSAVLYGTYRLAWLTIVEVVRARRTRKYGAFIWR